LGAGFEELVTSTHEDTPDNETNEFTEDRQYNGFQDTCHKFVNGIGSMAAVYFELSIYFLIAASVTVGIIQTVEGYENSFHQVEWISVILFTFEYIVRFIGVGADPEYARDNWSRLKYVVSFYSIVDLLAILPFYLSVLFPGSWFDQHDEYL
jgi:voltage-gated potassium channel